jgi:hypothetical protein
MKGFGTFLIGFGIAVLLAAGSIWLYDSSRVAVADNVEPPGVRLHDGEG